VRGLSGEGGEGRCVGGVASDGGLAAGEQRESSGREPDKMPSNAGGAARLMGEAPCMLADGDVGLGRCQLRWRGHKKLGGFLPKKIF
jgi:hypothetical protein